jgi:hypothetical protein
MALPMAGVRDAAPAPGPFPMIVYHPNPLLAYCDNATMCEYLASYGYVVATTHPLPQTGLEFRATSANLETITRDMEFVLGRAHEAPQIDSDRIGLIGSGFGAGTALLMQMRNFDVDVVACLDGGFYSQNFGLLRNLPGFDQVRAQAPVLALYRSGDSTLSAPPDSVCVHAERIFVGYPDMVPSDFNQWGIMGRLSFTGEGGASINDGRRYADLCRLTRLFMDANLKDDRSADNLLAHIKSEGTSRGATVEYLAAKKVAPTEQQFVEIVRQRGVDTALATYRDFVGSATGPPAVREAVINQLGYECLREGRMDEAVELLKLNTEAHPNSCNTWDSLSDAYLAAQDYQAALECARKTLEIIEIDQETDLQFKEHIRQAAQEKIDRLTDATEE